VPRLDVITIGRASVAPSGAQVGGRGVKSDPELPGLREARARYAAAATAPGDAR